MSRAWTWGGGGDAGGSSVSALVVGKVSVKVVDRLFAGRLVAVLADAECRSELVVVPGWAESGRALVGWACWRARGGSELGPAALLRNAHPDSFGLPTFLSRVNDERRVGGGNGVGRAMCVGGSCRAVGGGRSSP